MQPCRHTQTQIPLIMTCIHLECETTLSLPPPIHPIMNQAFIYMSAVDIWHTNTCTHTRTHTAWTNTHTSYRVWGTMISSCKKSPMSVWGFYLFPELFKCLLYLGSWYWWTMPPFAIMSVLIIDGLDSGDYVTEVSFVPIHQFGLVHQEGRQEWSDLTDVGGGGNGYGYTEWLGSWWYVCLCLCVLRILDVCVGDHRTTATLTWV